MGAAAPRPGQALAGIGFLVAATACFAVLDTAVKVVGAVVSVLLALWFRYAFHAVVVTAVMLPIRGRWCAPNTRATRRCAACCCSR